MYSVRVPRRAHKSGAPLSTAATPPPSPHPAGVPGQPTMLCAARMLTRAFYGVDEKIAPQQHMRHPGMCVQIRATPQRCDRTYHMRMHVFVIHLRRACMCSRVSAVARLQSGSRARASRAVAHNEF